MLAATPASGTTAGQASATGGEFTSSTARTSDGRAIDDTTKADVLGFWTQQRMGSATPKDNPDGTNTTADASGAPSEPGGQGEPQVLAEPVASSATKAGTTAAVAPSSAHAVGKVYFTDPIDNGRHYCSASVVTSDKGKLVQTAGHRVYSHTGADRRNPRPTAEFRRPVVARGERAFPLVPRDFVFYRTFGKVSAWDGPRVSMTN